jgi:hypothetical protein
LVFGDTADGVCSCAILSWLLDELDKNYHVICLDEVFPPYLEKLGGAGFVVFATLDPASQHKQEDSDLSDSSYVLCSPGSGFDEPTPSFDRRFDLRRVEDASASSLSYLVARCVGEQAERMAWISVLGSGGVQEDPISVVSWHDASRAGDVSRKIVADRERIFVSVSEKTHEIGATARRISSVARGRYYSDGPLEAVSSLRFREIERLWNSSAETMQIMDEVLTGVKERLQTDGVFASENVQWFDLEGSLPKAGPGTIDDVTSHVAGLREVVHREKYVVGMLHPASRIPGLGQIPGSWSRAACSVPSRLRGLVETGKRPPVSAIIKAAAFHHGGYGKGAETKGAALLPREEVTSFMQDFDQLSGE